ncbi:MAG: mechanosensitive ion channel family protein [Anaerococcus sp.]|nr:mechanosensitive ion channel family protein [Anaerococcus sp.]
MIEELENPEYLQGLVKNRLLAQIISIGIIIIIGLVVLSLLKKVIRKVLKRKELAQSSVNVNKLETVSKAVYSLVRVVVFFIIITLILDMFGINTSTIIATAGVGGIALALGTQTIIEDFIMGVFIILDDRIRVGEWVKVAGIEGEVESVEFRATKIRDFNGSLHIVPNSQIKSVQNFDRGYQYAEVYFNVSYETKLDEVKKMIEDVSKKVAEAEETKTYFKENFYFFEISEFKDFSYRVKVMAKVEHGSQWLVARAFKEAIKVEMEKKGIKSALLERSYEEIQD